MNIKQIRSDKVTDKQVSDLNKIYKTSIQIHGVKFNAILICVVSNIVLQRNPPLVHQTLPWHILI